MRVKATGTGTVSDVDPAYGARLIEQGLAVPAPQDAEDWNKKGPDPGSDDPLSWHKGAGGARRKKKPPADGKDG